MKDQAFVLLQPGMVVYKRGKRRGGEALCVGRSWAVKSMIMQARKLANKRMNEPKVH